METGELKTILALEPVWTISLNGHDFLSVSAADIEVGLDSIRVNGAVRIIEAISWLRPNVPRVHARPRFRSNPDVLTFYPGEGLSHPINTRRRRRAFQKQIAVALSRYLGVRSVEEITGSGRRAGISAAYLRFHAGRYGVIAVSPDEASPVIDAVMRAAILWAEQDADRIGVLVPAERRAAIVTRLESMPRLASAFDWLQWDGASVSPLDRSVNPIETHVDDRRRLSPPLETEAGRVVSMRPDLLRALPGDGGKSVSIRMRGLEVARIGDRETTYPLGAPLATLIGDLEGKRCYGSRHPLARVYEERWLESSLTDEIERVLPSVDPRHIYPQVPSFIGQERHTVDLLTVTKQGRLAVIEVKVGADPDLPFQALDYWLAVERHRKAGDFEVGGYFPGLKIQDEPALLVVVAPLLSFHRTFDRMVAHFPHNAPIVQIGIAESWKRGIRVLRRKGTVE